MSSTSVNILKEKLVSFFDKEGQIADVLTLLSKKEKEYLYKRLRVAFPDDNSAVVQSKLKFKAEAVNSLILLVVEKPQLSSLISDESTKNSKKIITQLYELLYDLCVSSLIQNSGNDAARLDLLVLASLVGICADKTPDVAMLIEQNQKFVDGYSEEKPFSAVKQTTFQYALSLFGSITNGDKIATIRRKERLALDAFKEFQTVGSSRDEIDVESGFLIGVYGNLLHVLKNVQEYLFTGETSAGDNINSLIETYIFNALKLSKALDIESLSNIVHHSRYALERLCANSIWHVADRSPLIKQFFQNSIKKGDQLLLTLLPSQRKTILDILTAKKSVVINMPTSAGKSLLAELYILYTIQAQSYKDFEPTIAYVVPTNALINQVKHKLRRIFGDTFRIESVLPFYEEDSLEEEILKAPNKHIHVFVTTPEKLDFLVRNSRPLISNLKLVILDEAHNLSEEGRGSKFELLLAIIKQKKSDVNYLLLSPFIKNAKQLARWLGDSDENSTEIAVSWTPTKQYVGCNTINAKLNESIVTYFPTPRNMIVGDRIDIPIEIDFNNLKQQLKSKSVDASVKTIGLLEKYLGIGGAILIFCQGAGSAQKMATSAASYFKGKGLLPSLENDPNIQRAVTLIEMENKPDDPLINLLKMGVAYHHSQLGGLIKEEIERLISLGLIRLIFATPTLAQGLNFPITTVIFTTTNLGAGKNIKEMPSSTFWNIAGRAGRAFMDSEGHVIVGYSDTIKGTIAKTEGYIKGDIKEIISSLSEFFKTVDNSIKFDYGLVKNNPGVSNFLQYLNHIIKVSYDYKLDHIDTAKIRSVLNNCLFYRQNLFETGFIETQAKINNFATEYVRYLKGEKKSQLSLADVFGISNISLNSVTARVIEYKDQVKATYPPNELNEHIQASKIILDTKNENDLARVVEILARVPELKVSMRDVSGKFDPLSIARVILGWVNGRNINSIAASMIKSNETIDEAIGVCNKFINGNLKNYIPWGLSIYQSLTDDVEDEVAKMLPSFVYYGVNNKEDVILSSLGLPRFAISSVKSILKNQYNQKIVAEEAEKIKETLKQIDDFGVGKSDSEKKNIKAIIHSYV